MTETKSYTSAHTIHPDAEKIISMGLDLFYQHWRHNKDDPIEDHTIRAVRMTDLKLLEFHANRNVQLGLYEDAQRGFKTIKHLKKVYRI